MSTDGLALFEPTALEVLNRRGTGLVRLIRGLLPEAWSTAVKRIGAYESALVPYVGAEYSKNQVNAALQDERLGKALLALIDATLEVARNNPRLARMTTPVWMIVPWRAYLDRDVRSEVGQTVSVLKEALGLMPRLAESTTLGEPFTRPRFVAGGLTTFVSDPEVPTSVAKRLLAGIRSRVTMDMIQTARRRRMWTTPDIKAALHDWSHDLLSAIGLLASYPGAHVPSLPRDYAFDFTGEIEKHKHRRERLRADARQAANELKK